MNIAEHLAAIEARNASRTEAVAALNLQPGDVLDYTEEVTRRNSNYSRRTYTMTITEVNGNLIKGINTNTGKPAKTNLLWSLSFALVSRAA